jgi:DNA-binding Lrp family transcriptional regulator
MGRRKQGIFVDPVDARIVQILQSDSRIPNTEIARRVKLSEGAVRKRIERLVREEVITFRAHADPIKVGFRVWAAYWIQAEPTSISSVADEVARLPEVFLVCLGTGEFDIYAVAVFRSTEEFNEFTNERLQKIRGVSRTRTSYLTKVLKRDFAFGVPNPDGQKQG